MSILIDWLLGVRTGGFVEPSHLGLLSEDVHGFCSSPWFTLQRILPREEVSVDDVLLDVGSGKGRIVISAALSYGFGRIQGVELSPDLAQAARGNIAAVRRRLRCRHIAIDVGDAGSLPIDDDVTVIYAYDPFEGPVFALLIKEVFESIDRRPRCVRMIYRAPLQAKVLLRTGRAAELRRAHGMFMRWDGDWPALVLYELR